MVLLITVPLIIGAVSFIREGQYGGLLPLGLAWTLVYAILFGMRYTIDGNILYVGSVFYRGLAYDLGKLDSITVSRTLISSPAASLSRIKLDFGCGRPLIISPASQDVFIEEVLRINPNVKVNI